MNILAINGSHRGQSGCTQWMLEKIGQGVREEGGHFDTVVLAEHTLLPCKGCESCHQPEQAQRCVLEEMDDVCNIFQRMRQADILIYASPVYIFTISSLMKTLLERFNSTAGIGELGVTKSGLFFGPVDHSLYSKPMVVFTCCGNIEPETTKNVESYFETFGRFLDAPLAGKLVRKSIGAFDEFRLGKVQPKPIIAEVLAAYVQAGRELARDKCISSATQKKANQQVLGVPFLDILLRFRWFKEMAIKRGRK